MVEYSGDHRICDNPDCAGKSMNMTQDISWNPKCMSCGKDLTNAPRAR